MNHFACQQILEDGKKKREEASRKLRTELEAGFVKPERRIYIHLPSLSDHENHFVGEVGGWMDGWMDDR